MKITCDWAENEQIRRLRSDHIICDTLLLLRAKLNISRLMLQKKFNISRNIAAKTEAKTDKNMRISDLENYLNPLGYEVEININKKDRE